MSTENLTPEASAEAEPSAAEHLPVRLTLAERAAHTNERHRDCRACKAFTPGPAGMAFGWCRAFKMPVKLYRPAGEFYSQCQFRVLTRPAREH